MTCQPPNDRSQGDALCPHTRRIVPPGCRGHGRVFCSKVCRLAFNARTKARGAVLAPFIQAQTQTRHAKAGTIEAEICRYARSVITQIGTIFNEQDDEAGRPPASAYVLALMRSGTRYIDRQR